jgi:hypothetical protein
MEQSSSAGPVQIVTITEDHKFVLDEKKLKQILFHKRAVGKKVLIKLKKFIFILSYLRFHLYQLQVIFVKENHLC